MSSNDPPFDPRELWGLAAAKVSNVDHYSYYIPTHQFAYNPVDKGMNQGVIHAEQYAAFLYAVYMKYAPIEQKQPAYHDGVSIIFYKDGTINVRLVLNNRVLDIPDRP